MKISNNENRISLEISTHELEKSGIDIHSFLTICEYPSSVCLKFFLNNNLCKNINNYYIESVYFSHGIWIINLELKKAYFLNKKIIKNFSKSGHHIYKNQKISSERKIFNTFYDYLNKSIYSKYISIKNGIIFIKDKSKEKYILNYLSEFE